MKRDTRLISIKGTPMIIFAEPECISDDIVKYGDFWEYKIFNSWYSKFPTTGLMLDIGANIGSHTLQFKSHFPNLEIWSFEPDFNNFTLLRENIKQFNNVYSFNVGVGSRTSCVSFNDGAEANCGVVSIVMGGKNKNIVIALDDMDFYNKEITFIKLDVEGHEYSCIEGMRNLLFKHKPMIWCEDLYPQSPTINLLSTLGYSVIESIPQTQDFLLVHKNNT